MSILKSYRILAIAAVLVTLLEVMQNVVLLRDLSSQSHNVSQIEQGLLGPPPPVLQRNNNESISACLLVMDDTIKLSEWIAYHYTIMPLGDLVVAIDPHSRKPQAIDEVLNRWKDHVDLTVWTDDTWMEIGPEEGWPGNDPHPEKGARLKEHRRRQRTFAYSCMRHLHQRKREWTLITDTDEFVMFNYRHPKSENYTLYDTLGRGRWKKKINQERQEMKAVRKALPPLYDSKTAKGNTIRQFLQKAPVSLSCMHLPGLSFTSYESTPEKVRTNIPEGVDPNLLTTLRHHTHGKRMGSFSKALVNLQMIDYQGIRMENIKSVHNPSTELCGENGKYGSGADYIASVLRLNHYVGTKEAYLERAGDVRLNHKTNDQLQRKNQEIGAVGVDDDIRSWIHSFVQQVGQSGADELLLKPLADAYSKAKKVE
jgi:hypothetical protein